MDGRSIKKLLLVTLFALPALASANSRSPANPPLRQDPNSNRLNLNILFTGASPQLKNELLEQSLLMNDSKISWPSLPRAWVEYASVDYVQSNTNVGFRLNPSVFGISAGIANKLFFDYRYQLKSSFVILVSRDQKNKGLFKFDEKNMRTFPDATQERPMVGLCIFESQFVYDRGGSFNFELAGSGETLNKGSIETITSTHISQFFQIDPTMSVDQYQNVCRTTYRDKIQDDVLTEFSRQIMNVVFHNHPQSSCKPEVDAQAGQSDSSCQEWFDSSVPKNLKGLTLARCELQRGGTHMCVLKAKKADVACPLYYNRQKGVVTERLTTRDVSVSEAGMDYPSFPCDRSSGLTCQVETQPWLLGGAPLRNGVGRCR